MSPISESTIAQWSIAALFLSPACLGAGCEEPSKVGYRVEDGDGNDFRGWSAYTSEEYPPLLCREGYTVRGVDCIGKHCDTIAVYCGFTDRRVGEHIWLPSVSEEGGHCAGTNMWMTGLACHGKYCDDLSLRCSELFGSSTGSCAWSDWYSEERPPFTAPAGRYVKGIECSGSYCGDKRYRFCWMD